MTRSRFLIPTLFLLVLGAAVSGCADSFISTQDEHNDTVSARPGQSKFRHAHLLDRAVRTNSAGKGASSTDSTVGLIIKVSGIVSRYDIVSDYRIVSRYEYDDVFYGLAAEVDASRLDSVLAEMENDPAIEWVEPDFKMFLPPFVPLPGSRFQLVPPSVLEVGGATSWTVSGNRRGSVDLDLFILDTGVTNGDLNIVESIDFREGFDDASDRYGHGTHIAGIAAAIDDRDGIAGIAPGARIHNFKVLGDDGTADASIVIAGLDEVLRRKLATPSTPMVVNMSLGEDVGTADYTALDDAVASAVAAGVVVVVAAGNHAKDASHVTPAHFEGAITVGSYGLFKYFSSYSNYGGMVDIIAPGDNILSLAVSADRAGTPVLMSGTSMATAHVSGAAVLYLALYPEATPQQVRDALVDAGRADVRALPEGTTDRSLWVGDMGSAGKMRTRY